MGQAAALARLGRTGRRSTVTAVPRAPRGAESCSVATGVGGGLLPCPSRQLPFPTAPSRPENLDTDTRARSSHSELK